MSDDSHSENVAALQRWTIAYAEGRRALTQAKAAQAKMAHEHDAALEAVRHFGGARTIGLLDGQRFCVQDYRGSGLLTAAEVISQ